MNLNLATLFMPHVQIHFAFFDRSESLMSTADRYARDKVHPKLGS